jgi:hypothetical protein
MSSVTFSPELCSAPERLLGGAQCEPRPKELAPDFGKLPIMRKSTRLFFLACSFCVLLSLTLAGCNTSMEAENAQTIKLEFKEGSGTVQGILKAGTPGMAGISSKNFDIKVPGSFEVKGGPSEYEIVFNSMPDDLRKEWTLSIDGEALKRGRDMIVEDDKGPRVSFRVRGKKA